MMKTAVVTGGSRGIGEAAVRELCSEGFAVAAVYNKSEEKCRRLVRELRAGGSECIALHADVSSPSEADALFERAMSLWGHIDALVCCAGAAQQKLFDETSDEEWERMLSVNLTGTFNCCRSAVKYMLRAKKGSIVTVSSMWGEHGASCEAAYSAAKGGIIGLTKALASEAAPSGIRVNCVSPGAVKTDMMSGFSEQDISALCEEIPLGRIAEPYEIASAIAFLVSEKASYITGQVLAVNGGMFR